MKKIIHYALSLVLVSSMLAGCVSVAPASNENKTETSVSTSTETTASVSTETTVSKEDTTAPADTETGASTEDKQDEADEKEPEHKDKAIKTTTQYMRSYETGELVLSMDFEYDEYGYLLKYYYIGECEAEMPYTATRTQEGEYLVYRYTYDSTGWSEDALSWYSEYMLDYVKRNAKGREVYALYKDGHEAITEYDSNEKLVRYESNSQDYPRVEEYTYDAEGRTLTSTYTSGDYVSSYSYQYDLHGNEITETYTTPYNTTLTVMEYDDRNNMIKEYYSYTDGSYATETTLEYDEQNNLIHKVTYNANSNIRTYEIFYEYDSKGRETKETRHVLDYETGEVDYIVDVTYEYDANGNQTKSECTYYDKDGALEADSGYKYEYEYDEHGNVTRNKYTSSWYEYEYTYSYVYDEDGSETEVNSYIDGELHYKTLYTYFE